MPPFQLYAFGESGNAYKVALMLEACGLEWQAVPVDFFNGETRADKYRNEVNEMGEVPVLVHKGRKLAQSGAILTFLAEHSGRFSGTNADEKLEILSWMLFDNHKFTSYLATLRFMVAFLKSGETPVTEFLRGRTKAALAIVEKHLATRRYMVGEKPSIADFSLAGYVYMPEDYGIDWTAHPHIQAWKGRLASMEGWKPPYEMLARAPARLG